MPNGSNYECGDCSSSYSTLYNYSGAQYLPLCSSGRVIQPTFDAVSGYQTGYCGSKANTTCCCDSTAGKSYGTMGCVYNDSCACKPCKSQCAPVCMPSQQIATAAGCGSCSGGNIIKGCGKGCC